ncbi:MAG: glutathione S-transferase N-terminal domain-containing protein [Alphaproteobacteria bacterium]|nr:glutathione S-transferase N-terminal domain-containing protein [Alphaproteobacteria bacterium]MBV8335043.1 glutathione S-transferase N-terminal domain-containing protein [Alphaproteobacteria bacterium]
MLSHFPSPNPQEVAFALKELALDREIVPVGLARGKHRQPRFLARNPLGRVPALVGGELTLPGSHAILAYLQNPLVAGIPSPGGKVDAVPCYNGQCRPTSSTSGISTAPISARSRGA